MMQYPSFNAGPYTAASADSPDSPDFDDSDSESGVAVAEAKPRLAEPPKYAVVLHNDDYTTMEFVIEVLRKYFRKTEEQAVEVMMQVHNQGKGIAGIYSYEIAETKVVQVHQFARTRGYPLLCSVEPAAP